MISKKESRLEYIDVVRHEDRKIHVLGRSEKSVSCDGASYTAHHIIFDAQTGKVFQEDSFRHIGSFPLFMCGCYILSFEGECPPLLDHELSLEIYENRLKADKYEEHIRKFKEANLKEIKHAGD